MGTERLQQLSGNDAEVAGARHAAVDSVSEEMAAFDQLGPLTQAVLVQDPLKYLAADLLRQARANGMDPKARDIDVRISSILRANTRELILQERGMHDASLPFTLKRIPRRERQAASARWL